MPLPTIDLAICTHGRGEEIFPIFEMSKPEFGLFNKIIVVDNNPNGLPASLRERFESAGVQIVRELKTGLSPARTKGLSESKADYVWFIDDDASLTSGFAANAKRHIEHLSILPINERPVAGGGLILAASNERDTSDIGAFELGLLSCMNPQSKFVQPWGANMFVDRAVALEAGGFQFGTRIANLGDEDECFQRMHKLVPPSRQKFFFAEGCAVQHWIPDSRRQFKWLLSRAYKGGRVNFIVYRSFSGKEIWPEVGKLLRTPSKDNCLRLAFVAGKMRQRMSNSQRE